jgi:acetylornithine/succinyldiaminopimelate/putrescine aminotransferase
LRELADEYDALLIFDEVQCGIGRTGHLWAYQGYGVEPDILTAAKPLANGLPIGAILMRQKVADAMHPGDHASTFAGNPYTTHVAHHVVSRIAEPAFLADVKAKGELLVDLLEELNSPHILEIRAEGLMVGVQMDIEAAQIMTKAFDRGLLVLIAGPNVLRFVPPLVISEEEIKQAVATVGEILLEL